MQPDKDLPLVSIVTPSYNQAQFLEETMRSVLDQDYPRLEYLVIDGGSTDGSVEIIKKYESRLAYSVSERDAGQSDAINKGWRRARGDIVAYLNSDDTYTPGAIRAGVKALMREPNAGLSFGICTITNAEGQPIGLIKAQPFTLSALILQNQIAQPATFVRKSALDRIGLLDTSLHYVMDYDLWLRLSIYFPAVCVPQTLANFRLHDDSKTSSRAKHFLDENLASLAKVFADPHLPPEMLTLRERAENRAFFQWALQCYSSYQWRDGRDIMDRFYESQPNPMAFPLDAVKLFANHLVSVLPLKQSDWIPGDLEADIWLNRVFESLPAKAADLSTLRHQILSEANLAWGFQAHARGEATKARNYMLRGLRHDPHAAGNRGVWSVLVKNTLPRAAASSVY